MLIQEVGNRGSVIALATSKIFALFMHFVKMDEVVVSLLEVLATFLTGFGA